MAIKTSGQLSFFDDIRPEYTRLSSVSPYGSLGDVTPYSIDTYANLTAGLTAGSLTRFSSFYGRESAYSFPVYNNQRLVNVYFPVVDRNIYWTIDLKNMNNWISGYNSDCAMSTITIPTTRLRPLIDPSNYGSLSIGLADSVGRGFFAVVQQPTATNQWVAVVTADDNGPASRGDYTLRINVTALNPSRRTINRPYLFLRDSVYDISESTYSTLYPTSATVILETHPKATITSASLSINSTNFSISNYSIGGNQASATVTNIAAASGGSNYQAVVIPNFYQQYGGVAYSTMTATATISYAGLTFSNITATAKIISKFGTPYTGY